MVTIYLGELLPIHSSSLPADIRGEQPICCLALLLMRFTLPHLLPDGRWALTSPFHPYPFGR